MKTEEHLPECPKSGCPACFEQGQRDALAAAREAVEVLLKEWWEKFEGTPSDLKEMKSMVELNRAIAAIDARQKEQ